MKLTPPLGGFHSQRKSHKVASVLSMDVNQINDRIREKILYKTANRVVNMLLSYIFYNCRRTLLCSDYPTIAICRSLKVFEAYQERCVETFHLSISLRVVGCSLRVSNAAELVELVKKFVFKPPFSVVVSGLRIPKSEGKVAVHFLCRCFGRFVPSRISLGESRKMIHYNEDILKSSFASLKMEKIDRHQLEC